MKKKHLDTDRHCDSLSFCRYQTFIANISIFKGRVQIFFDGKSVMDNINETPTFYKGVKLFQGYTKGQDPYTFPGPNGENWSQFYVTPDVSYEYFEYKNFNVNNWIVSKVSQVEK